MLYFFNLCCTYSITIDNIYTLAKGTCGAEHVNYDFVKATTLTD